MKKTNEVTLKEAIRELIETYKLGSKLNEVNIRSSWVKLMGKMIAKHTEEIKLVNHKLFIKLSSSALRQELSYAKSKIIKLLNEELGNNAISEVVLQ
ncbi:MAG: DUF721 domain-containing protein [Saprospiraceae bacterium]|nr:DUF721 domain-containing protein [Saprospiraceae bacterium]